MTDRGMALMMLDVDHFKSVNDRYGHAGGDLALKHLVGSLAGGIRRGDLLGRLGGEEFAIALPETGPDGALELAERVRSRIEAEEIPLLGREGTIRITASLGAATMPGLSTNR